MQCRFRALATLIALMIQTKFLRLIPLFVITLLLSACATEDSSIMSIAPTEKIGAVYVVNDPATMEVNENVLPEIASQLAVRGYVPIIVLAGDVPPDACQLTFSARMTGHTIKTLTYLRIDIRRGKRMLGSGFSDASNSVDRFSNTGERVRALMDGIFRYAKPESVVR